jgi:hypothetical protein
MPRLLLLGLALFLTSTPALAQIHVLPYGGYGLGAGYDNGASFLAQRDGELDPLGGVVLGLGAEFLVGWDRLPFLLYLRPAVETTLTSGEAVTFDEGEALDFSQRLWHAGLSLVGEIPVGRAPVVPYAGFGFTYARYSADFDASGGAAIVTADGDEVESLGVTAWALAPDLTAGLRLGRGRVSPFVEARYRFATPEPEFTARPGEDLDNGFSAVVGARIAL